MQLRLTSNSMKLNLTLNCSSFCKVLGSQVYTSTSVHSVHSESQSTDLRSTGYNKRVTAHKPVFLFPIPGFPRIALYKESNVFISFKYDNCLGHREMERQDKVPR